MTDKNSYEWFCEKMALAEEAKDWHEVKRLLKIVKGLQELERPDMAVRCLVFELPEGVAWDARV